MEWEILRVISRLLPYLLPPLTSMICLYGWYSAVSQWAPEDGRPHMLWSLRMTALIIGLQLAFNLCWFVATWSSPGGQP